MTNTDTYIPTAEEVGSGRTQRARFAKGQLVKGKEEEGNFQVIGQMVGRLVKIGISEYTDNDGRTNKSFNVDLMTSDGPDGVTVKYFARNKYGAYSQGLGLMRKIATILPGQLISISASAGEEQKNENGDEYTPTYANVSIIPIVETADGPKPGRPRPVITKHDGSALKGGDAFDERINVLRNHPAWGEYGTQDEDSEDSAHPIASYVENRGWPNYSGYKDVYDAELTKALGGDYLTMDWAAVRVKLDAAKQAPKGVRDAVAADAAKPVEFDPFAD